MKRGSEVQPLKFRLRRTPEPCEARQSSPNFSFSSVELPQAARSAAVKFYFFISMNEITSEPSETRQSSPTFQFKLIELAPSRAMRGSQFPFYHLHEFNYPRAARSTTFKSYFFISIASTSGPAVFKFGN